MKTRIAILFFAAIAAASAGIAQDRTTVEINPFGGYLFGGKFARGSTSLFTSDVDVDDHATYGGRLGFLITRSFELELQYSRTETAFVTRDGGDLFGPGHQRLGDLNIDYYLGYMDVQLRSQPPPDSLRDARGGRGAARTEGAGIRRPHGRQVHGEPRRGTEDHVQPEHRPAFRRALLRDADPERRQPRPVRILLRQLQREPPRLADERGRDRGPRHRFLTTAPPPRFPRTRTGGSRYAPERRSAIRGSESEAAQGLGSVRTTILRTPSGILSISTSTVGGRTARIAAPGPFHRYGRALERVGNADLLHLPGARPRDDRDRDAALRSLRPCRRIR